MGATMFGGETIGERLTAARGRTTGFDYLRAGLSISVIAFHSVLTSYGEAHTRMVWNGWWRPFIAKTLPRTDVRLKFTVCRLRFARLGRRFYRRCGKGGPG